jgi:hypothetical protein
MSDLQLCQGDWETSQILAGTFIRLAAQLYDWRSRPVVVCDSDHCYFGVAMEADTGRITDSAFNGLV